MGCTWCCESLSDLICLKCHNWACRIGIDRHGDVVPNEKVPRVLTDRGLRLWNRTTREIGQEFLDETDKYIRHEISRPQYSAWMRQNGWDKEAIEIEKSWDNERTQYAKSRIVREQMAKTRSWMLYDWEKQGEEQAEHSPEGSSDGEKKG